MKIRRLFLLGIILFLVLADNVVSTVAISFVNKKPIFTEKEEIINGLRLLDTKEKVLRILGKPKSIKKVYWGIYGNEVEYFYYDWGYVLMSPFFDRKKERRIESVEITNKKIIGPRGIKIGDDYKKVIESFRCEIKEIPYSSLEDLKLYEVVRSNGEGLFGIVRYEEKISSIEYHVKNEKNYYEFGLRFELVKGKVSKIFAYYFPGD